MKNAARQSHIDELCAELGIDVVQRPGMPGMMFVEYEPPMIEGPTIFMQSEYYTMLHEIGHVVSNHTQGRPPYDDGRHQFYFDNGVLRSEAEAWEWAMNNAIAPDDELEDETRAFMWRTCMGSYYRHSKMDGERTDCRMFGNGNRHWVRFKWDKPDPFFWAVKGRMLGIETEEAAAQEGVTLKFGELRSLGTSPITVPAS